MKDYAKNSSHKQDSNKYRGITLCVAFLILFMSSALFFHGKSKPKKQKKSIEKVTQPQAHKKVTPKKPTQKEALPAAKKTTYDFYKILPKASVQLTKP